MIHYISNVSTSCRKCGEIASGEYTPGSVSTLIPSQLSVYCNSCRLWLNVNLSIQLTTNL